MVRALLVGTKTQTRRAVKRPARYERLRECTHCCPYGIPGDRLWVRETHYVESEDFILYRADDALGDYPVSKWTPGIHMFRRSSRISLELTDVRVERLQEISQDDALAEGMPAQTGSFVHHVIADYRRLWESLNGAGSWDANPWVWVLTFKRVHDGR